MPLTEVDLPPDIYRVKKEQLQLILSKFNIKYRDEDLVAELRPIVADLKAFVKNNWSEEKKLILKKLLSKRCLSEAELLKHPLLNRIHKFISDRENLYDTPASDSEEDENYEDIEIASEDLGEIQLAGTSLNVHLPQPLNNTVCYVNQPPLANNMAQPKENLPLISAGTYHGLVTENPSDFIDKYEIAAQSNNWQETSKLNLFPAHLAGTALTWYQHYMKGRLIDSWDELKNTFINTFTPVAQAQTLQNILDKKVQGQDQPVLTYYLEVLTLCKRHDPEMSEKRIGQYIIQGLRPEFCDRVLSETCETLEQLETSLRKIELQLQIKLVNREKYNRAEREELIRGDTDSREQINNLQAEIRSLTQIVSNMTMAGTPQRQIQPDFYPQMQQQQRSFPNNNGRGHSFRSSAIYRPRQQYGTPAEWNPQHNVHRGANQLFQSSRSSPTTSGHRQPAPHYYNYGTHQPSSSYMRRDNVYCNICKRNNHKTQDCRYRNHNDRNNSSPTTTRYCDHCKMTNHSREQCFRLNPTHNRSKNV